MENIGGGEILLILVVILIFFGPKKIPELAASLGKGLRKFNEAKDGFESQMKTVMKEPLDAINSAKAGFEATVMQASQPLREVMTPPASLSLSTPSAGIPTAGIPSGAIPSIVIPDAAATSAPNLTSLTAPTASSVVESVPQLSEPILNGSVAVRAEPIPAQQIPPREA